MLEDLQSSSSTIKHMATSSVLLVQEGVLLVHPLYMASLTDLN